MQKIGEKIIWTLKEVEEEFEKQRREAPTFEELLLMSPYELYLHERRLPLARIKVASGEVVKISDISKVNGFIKYIIVSQPF